MAKCKPVFEEHIVFLPLSAATQFQVESFDFCLHFLFEEEIVTHIFEKKLSNHKVGAPAYHPKVLLKINFKSLFNGSDFQSGN
jgi:hypothetical protein